MKRLLAMLLVLGACGTDHSDPDAGMPPNNDVPFDQCDGDPASFVRQTFLALDGRRPLSQAEVDVYVDLFTAAGASGKQVVAQAIMARPEFAERWVDVAMDALHVQRVDIQTEAACWDDALRGTVDGALATAVRDGNATTIASGGQWTMLDLARSAIALDDLSPIYRAQLFSLVSHPIPAANVAPVEAELARREDYGQTFDGAYLHRDIVCLGCHNSQHSVTDSDDPAVDRFWPAPGLPEKPVFGASAGEDVTVAHAVFRYDGFADGGGSARPWGWASACGTFQPSVAVDPAGIAAKLASVTGTRATVYDLEAAMKRGFDMLRAGAPTSDLTDPDAALAWLVTLQMTETIYKEVTGTGLTIANYFPRNQASSELLVKLATTLATSNYSLKALLAAIVATPYFNRKPAEAGCGATPYTYPNVFDPWVIADADPARRKNGPGDAVTAVDSRTLISATKAALGWGPPPAATRFPDYGEPGCETETCQQLPQDCAFHQCCATKAAVCDKGGVSPLVELPFERGVGMFLRNSERGFRGLDFQALLTWEDRYGMCGRPAWVASDFIDGLVAAGAASTTATVQDVILALKDRLVGEPRLAEGAEQTALEAIVGPIGAPASALDAGKLREVCGALLASPQFLLQGIAGRGGLRPVLTPTATDYGAICAQVATAIPGVACGDGTLTLTSSRRAAPAPVRVPLAPVPVRHGKTSRLRR